MKPNIQQTNLLACTCCLLALILCNCLIAEAQNQTPKGSNTSNNYYKKVNPFIGTGSHGHTFPGATMPFGMVQLSPDTRLEGWDGCSAYHYSDSIVYGFSHTHLSGTGVSDYGDVLLMPTTGEVVLHNGADGEKGYRSAFSKKNEKAHAGYYTTFLNDYQIGVALTATERAGFHQYVFPKTAKKSANIILDLAHRDKVLDSSVKMVNEQEIAGYRISKGWAEEQHVYFVIQFSQPFVKYGLAANDEIQKDQTELKGEQVKAYFQFDAAQSQEVLVKVGISAVSVEGARKNLEKEIPHWNFRQTRTAVEMKWNVELSKIKITGGTKDQQTTFYTALYHTMIAPNLFMDVDGQYRGTDLKVHQATNHTNYTIFSLWDTYRATHPLYTIIDQKRTNDFIQTFLAHYQNGGKLPVWELAGNYTGCMIGYHSVSVIADAYIKGINNYDADLALAAMKHSANLEHLGLKSYQAMGFIPAEEESESVSKTLEYAYDDWCIAQMAKKMGQPSDYKTYLQRAQSYKNVFDPSTGFMRAKINNQWINPFDPAEVNYHYTEANSWQYSFYVPQDITGWINLLGGKKSLENKLDKLFTTNSKTSGRDQVDITGLIGQYAHGNEPSHHIAYLYNYLNKPWKTQKKVRQIMDELYFNAPDGLSGNEDCGQMSAWYILSAMGFYPIAPGSETYVIGTPLFEEIKINLENGNKFVIKADNYKPENIFIANAQLNNKPHQQSFINHSDIMQGGHLIFEMAEAPNKDWGTAETAIPISEITEHLIVTAPVITNGKKAFAKQTTIELTSLTKNTEIYYTLDGSTPSKKSTKYTAPFILSDAATLKAIAYQTGVGQSAVISTKFNKMPDYEGISLLTKYANHYAAGGDNALIDGIRGGNDYRTGTWQGYEGKHLEAVINLGNKKTFEEIGIGFLQDENSWIFMPLEVEFYCSNNGKKFKKLGVIKNNVSPKDKGGINKDFVFKSPKKIKTKYLKIKGLSRKYCPDFHKGAGGKSWIFADEIWVK